MKWTCSPKDGSSAEPSDVGGKGAVLLDLFLSGFPVPEPLCITTSAYHYFVGQNGLRQKINLELNRKKFAEMRWEEIWDISLRIQNMFLTADMPEELHRDIHSAISKKFHKAPLVLRSSAPDEDRLEGSFAGLHESYLNISGVDEITAKIKKVWASLWSDRALLYRQELGLDVGTSNMAVVIQELIEGEGSGVVFSQNPLDATQLIIEAVPGLNQGLVDGDIEPDRWIIRRKDGRLVSHHCPANRTYHLVRSETTGVVRRKLGAQKASQPPLVTADVNTIADLAMALEKRFGRAQDIEWTLAKKKVFLLQSRPVTTGTGGDKDKRSWYLSLHRSYDNLIELRHLIENNLLPQMDRESAWLASLDLQALSDIELADELEKRLATNEHWTTIYWSDFIPFAHGVRLFGELYNDVMQPADPYEFVALLSGQSMLSTERNTLLHQCAEMVRKDDALRHHLETGTITEVADGEFQAKLDLLEQRFSVYENEAEVDTGNVPSLVAALILQYTTLDGEPLKMSPERHFELESQFLQRAANRLPVPADELLDMARASYRIRDDDNIHIGRIAGQLDRAVASSRKRLEEGGVAVSPGASAVELVAMLRKNPVQLSAVHRNKAKAEKKKIRRVRARQLVGQPASSGVARGRARVVTSSAELKKFKKGEILVTDSIDPTMTFFAPLAAAIVERRGGMLIHGAIIAREYGIPCITGITEAATLIQTGDMLSIDGYLGIVTVQRHE